MTTLKDLADAIAARKAEHDGQLVVAMAGPPASGKSTLSSELLVTLKGAIVIGMDGFHLDNGILEDRDLIARKGSSESFDVAGLKNLMKRLALGESVFAPVFDRELDLARAGAVRVSPEHEIVIVEGNYLLLNEAPWLELQEFWDMSIMLSPPVEILKERLIHRWRDLGLSVEKAHAKVAQNDLPNAEHVLGGSLEADCIVGDLKG